MTNLLLRPAALALALATALGACKKNEDAPAQDAGHAPSAAAVTSAESVGRGDAVPAAAEDAPLEVSDLDAYARGMQREASLLEAAGAKLAQARAQGDPDAEATAMAQMVNLDTDVQGAQASGLSQARYMSVKAVVDGVLGKQEMLASLKASGAPAPEDLPAEQRQQLEAGRADMEATIGNPFQGLSADVVQAFKARQAELAGLRAKAIGARFNAAH